MLLIRDSCSDGRLLEAAFALKTNQLLKLRDAMQREPDPGEHSVEVAGGWINPQCKTQNEVFRDVQGRRLERR